jgi:Tol biopolymer transport system component
MRVVARMRKALLFLTLILSASFAAPQAQAATPGKKLPAGRSRFLFTSQGKTGIVNSDGTGLRYFDFKVPGQAAWQPGPEFGDGRRVVMLSMEPRRDGPGRPFSQYYSQTPTHIWAFDLKTGSLEELCKKNRLAPFETPALLISDERILVQVVRNMVGQIYSMHLDGTDAREFTKAAEGMPYGLSLSPDSRRVACHLATSAGYQVWTFDLEGKNRVKVAAKPGHLYFGTSWSPDGKWILYVDCQPGKYPDHEWADVCIGRADGSEHRVLTKGEPMWFAATYGDPKTRGSGSNLPAWTADGAILFPRRLPDSRTAWEFQPQRPDVDHFNRDFKLELARGGTEICRLDPKSGQVTRLTHSEPPVWDFRAVESADGRKIAFCRAATGGAAAIWVMDADGANAHKITGGVDGRGADHPKWLP